MSNEDIKPKNFYANISFDKVYLGTWVISVPGDTPDDLVLIAVLQAQEKLIRQRLHVNMVEEKEYLIEVAKNTTITKKEG